MKIFVINLNKAPKFQLSFRTGALRLLFCQLLLLQGRDQRPGYVMPNNHAILAFTAMRHVWMSEGKMDGEDSVVEIDEVLIGLQNYNRVLVIIDVNTVIVYVSVITSFDYYQSEQ